MANTRPALANVGRALAQERLTGRNLSRRLERLESLVPAGGEELVVTVKFIVPDGQVVECFRAIAKPAQSAEQVRGVIVKPEDKASKPAAEAPRFSVDPYYWAPFFLMGNWLYAQLRGWRR